MRAVLLALLAVGALHALPLEHGSGLEEASSAATVEGSGSGDVLGVLDGFDNHISTNEGSGIAIDTTHSVKNDNNAILERSMNFFDSEENDRFLREVNDEEGSATPLKDGNATETDKCETLRVCHDDSDCNGGRCVGLFLGTCNCNSCMSFWKCSDDGQCGGFKQACNTTTGMCDCFGAYVLNGYKDTLDALGHLCNVKQCGRDTAADDCFGLPCNTGRCFC